MTKAERDYNSTKERLDLCYANMLDDLEPDIEIDLSEYEAKQRLIKLCKEIVNTLGD